MKPQVQAPKFISGGGGRIGKRLISVIFKRILKKIEYLKKRILGVIIAIALASYYFCNKLV